MQTYTYDMQNSRMRVFDKLIKQEAINFGKLIGFNYQTGRGLGAGDLDTLVKVIEESTVLQELDLSRCNLTLHDDSYSLAKKGNIAKAFAKNTTIKVLNLSHNMISLQGVKNLAAAIKENKTLTHLDINHNRTLGNELDVYNSRIRDEGFRILAEALVENESIYWLELDYKSIRDDYIVQSLVSSLTENFASTKKIDLHGLINEYYNHAVIEAYEYNMLYEAAKQSTVIEELDLSYNHIPMKDGKLADIIAHNKSIRVLNLSYLKNNINKGIELLYKALKKNETLQHIYLDGNELSDEGIKYLADVIKVNKTLKKMSLNDNDISDEGIKIMTDAMKANTSIHELCLSDNGFSEEEARGACTLANESLELHLSTLEHIYKCTTMNKCSNPYCHTMKSQLNGGKVNTLLKIHAKDCRNVNCPIPQCSCMKENENRYDIVQLRVDLNVKNQEIESKDKEIALLKEALKNSKQEVDMIDLTSGEGTEESNKRPRTDDTPKSNLALLHEQNKKHHQRLVKVKKEKSEAETNLENVRGQKQAVESNLEETRADLEDAEELVGQQTIATNIWQGRFDELVSLAEAAGVDGAAISGIRNRSLASGS